MMYLVLSNSPAVSVSASRPGISDEQARQLFDAASGPKERKMGRLAKTSGTH